VVSTRTRFCLPEQYGCISRADVDAPGWRLPSLDVGTSAICYRTDCPGADLIEVRNETVGAPN